MAYQKTDWKARIGSLLNRFGKEQETDRSVVLHNQPGLLTQAGTPVSIQNLNKIEQGIFDAHELAELVTQKVLDVISKIPNQASVNNQLADKNFVNSSISNMAANYVTPDAAGEQQWANLDALRAGPWFHGGTPYAPTQNDYAIFINDDNSVWRATFDGNLWSPTYKVNDTPFTAAQLSALNSQITAALVQKLLNPDTTPTLNSSNLITSAAVYEAVKPVIPPTIIYSSNANLRQQLINEYGGIWERVSDPVPRQLTHQSAWVQLNAGETSNTNREFYLCEPGNSIGLLTVSFSPVNTYGNIMNISIKSSTRGILQTLNNEEFSGTFNTITSAIDEQISVVQNNIFSSNNSFIRITGVFAKLVKQTEYIYIKI
ncbi:MAG: hypothetical protein FWB73_02905 [Treponema sp.]|nr:hypothetical protein [Treponema sp.]